MVNIFLGFACNNACVLRAGPLRDKEEGPPDVAAQLAAIVAGETVAFTGGEPTIDDELPAWIKAAEAKGAARVIVQTNGRRLAYRAFTRALREASTKLALDVALQGFHGGDARVPHGHAGELRADGARRTSGARRAHPCRHHHRGHPIQLPTPRRDRASRPHRRRRGDSFRQGRAIRSRRDRP